MCARMYREYRFGILSCTLLSHEITEFPFKKKIQFHCKKNSHEVELQGLLSSSMTTNNGALWIN